MHPWSVTAAKVFVAVALGALLYFARAAFIPIALALLLALILSGPVGMLQKMRVPRAASAVLILVTALTLLGGAVALMWSPAQVWYAKAPQTLNSLKHKVQPISRFFDRIDELRKDASNLSSPASNPAPPQKTAATPTEATPALILNVWGPATASALTFVIVTLFLLAGGPPMLARMTAAFVDNLKASHVLGIIEKVRAEVGRYYLTTTLINLGLGVATGLTMWAWGLPTPYLWGALAAVLNYVPYAGSATTLLVITLVAAVSFNTLGPVIAAAGSYVVLATIEGQIVQPLLVGRRLEVNPLLVFLGLWFGGLFWGVAGILLATPVLVTLKVIAESSKSGNAMMEFLGSNQAESLADERLRRLSRRMRA